MNAAVEARLGEADVARGRGLRPANQPRPSVSRYRVKQRNPRQAGKRCRRSRGKVLQRPGGEGGEGGTRASPPPSTVAALCPPGSTGTCLFRG